MEPIRSRRSLVSPASSSFPMSSPPTYAVPEVARSSPAMHCMSVDFPEPDGPMTAVNRPRSKDTLTSSSARTAAGPAPLSALLPGAFDAAEMAARSERAS